ncbi:MAG: PilZ domain-containing protein [Spirochaetales bacterium]|nr:PilZ domain-containing protein [Spirochaetales bacterium]
MTDRRQYKRADIDVLVNNSLVTRAPISNVSENGICIAANTVFTRGDILFLHFTLPCNTEIKAYGKVKWHQQDDNGECINGLEFWHIEDEYREQLIRFVKSWTRQKDIVSG